MLPVEMILPARKKILTDGMVQRVVETLSKPSMSNLSHIMKSNSHGSEIYYRLLYQRQHQC